MNVLLLRRLKLGTEDRPCRVPGSAVGNSLFFKRMSIFILLFLELRTMEILEKNDAK